MFTIFIYLPGKSGQAGCEEESDTLLSSWSETVVRICIILILFQRYMGEQDTLQWTERTMIQGGELRLGARQTGRWTMFRTGF